MYRVKTIKTWYGPKYVVRNENNQTVVLESGALASFDNTREGINLAKKTAKELNKN